MFNPKILKNTSIQGTIKYVALMPLSLPHPPTIIPLQEYFRDINENKNIN